MGHADSVLSVYGSSILWLSNFVKGKIVKYRAFIGGKSLSHSIELTESACLVGLRDMDFCLDFRSPTILFSFLCELSVAPLFLGLFTFGVFLLLSRGVECVGKGA